MPAFPSDNQLPTPGKLAKEFNLEAKGQENGEDGYPKQDHTGLDKEESQVEQHCHELLRQRIENYHKEVDVLQQRIDEGFLLPVSPDATVRDQDASSAAIDAAASDPDKEKARLDLENVINTEGPDLKRLKSEAQNAIRELNNFKAEHLLQHTPKVPDSSLQSWGILIGAIAVETVLNGFFFGANMAEGVVGGVFYAALISTVNVIVFGYLGALTYRQIAHRRDLRKFAGILGLVAVIVAALCFNFAVAHYRDALPPDYPPETASVEATEAERQIAACYKGDSDIEASQEAWCLFTTRTYRLDGFLSYLLLLIGLAACVVGAGKLSRMTDAYPGYGKLGRNQLKTGEELGEKRREVLEKLESTWGALREEAESAFDDPVERFKRTDDAVKKRDKLYDHLLAYATNLEESCRGAIKIYRAANQMERQERQPHPPYWDERWKAAWKLPEKPPLLRICGIDYAENLKQRERAILNNRLKAINDCYETCRGDVEAMTKLKFAAT